MSSVLLVGKPNCGKSLLFNQLTGLNQKVSNFPGVTVQTKRGRCGDFDVIDHPGIYSLNAITKDEQVSIQRFEDALGDKSVKGVVCVLDATRLHTSLRLAFEVREKCAGQGKHVIFVFNMADELPAQITREKADEMQMELGVPVYIVSARKAWGLNELESAIDQVVCSAASLPMQPEVDSNKPFDIDGFVGKHFSSGNDVFQLQNSIDRFFLSPWFGGVLFLGIMAVLFQAIFTWATPMMDFMESIVIHSGEWVSALLPSGVFRDFVSEALFGGVGAFVVFVPQIFVLTFIIGLLEDSGYLARAALICHKPLSYFGMTGKSFVPLLTGHACAIPAIYAARTIDSPKKRFITMLLIPLMACSARLPVYSLLIVTLIPATTFAGGLLGLQGLAFASMYLFGFVVALIVGALLSNTVFKKENDAPFILELPPYRLPHWKPLLVRSVNMSWTFLSKAGPLIFVVTLVVWVLGYFPNGTGNLDSSWLASMGKWIEPVFKPLGIDWKFGVAIMASFLAREVFVGTLGTLVGIEAADENITGLSDVIARSGLSLASGISLLVFYAIALQCISTVAVLKDELGSKKWAWISFFGYGILAYVLAWVTYQLFS